MSYIFGGGNHHFYIFFRLMRWRCNFFVWRGGREGETELWHSEQIRFKNGEGENFRENDFTKKLKTFSRNFSWIWFYQRDLTKILRPFKCKVHSIARVLNLCCYKDLKFAVLWSWFYPQTFVNETRPICRLRYSIVVI